MFRIEEILSLVKGVSFYDGYEPFPFLCHLYGGEGGGVQLAKYMMNQDKVHEHLFRQVIGLRELSELSFEQAKAALPAFKLEHGETFNISPLRVMDL